MPLIHLVGMKKDLRAKHSPASSSSDAMDETDDSATAMPGQAVTTGGSISVFSKTAIAHSDVRSLPGRLVPFPFEE
jgi:hypothetical protein